MDDELKALFKYYSYKLEIIERNRQLEQQLVNEDLECVQEQLEDLYLYESCLEDCSDITEGLEAFPEWIEDGTECSELTCSAVEHLPESVAQLSPQAHDLADSLANESDNELVDATIASSPAECHPVTDQHSFSLCLGPYLYLCINKRITVNTLTCFRGFAPEAPSGPTGYGTCHKIWNPGLCVA